MGIEIFRKNILLFNESSLIVNQQCMWFRLVLFSRNSDNGLNITKDQNHMNVDIMIHRNSHFK